MIRNILYTCLAMAALHCMPSRAAESDSLRMEWTDSTKLALDFMLTPGDVEVKTNYRLIMTPRIVGENGDTLSLPDVEFAGAEARRYFDRLRFFNNIPTTRTVYTPKDTVRYSYTADVTPWMRRGNVRIIVDREFEDCCDVTDLSPLVLGTTRCFVPKPVLVVPKLSVAEEIAEREPVMRPIGEYRPYTRDIPLRKMKGALYVHFPLDKTILREDFRDNKETLSKILDMMRRVKADTTSSIVKVVIIGLASPEGPLANNERLGKGRAEALKNYLVERIDMPDSTYEVINGGEAWADLRDVVSESDLEAKQKVLDIIDNTPDLNRREALIRKVDGGKVYRYLRQNVFADQRNSGYIQVYYEAIPDTAARIINEAIKCISDGRYKEAIGKIENLNDNRKWNTLGVALYFAGRKQEALDCFREAVKCGNEGAQQNLEELEKAVSASGNN